MENEFADLIKKLEERGQAQLNKPEPTEDDRVVAEFLRTFAKILQRGSEEG